MFDMDHFEKCQRQMDMENQMRWIRILIEGAIEAGISDNNFLYVMEKIKKQAETIIETKKEIDKWQDAPKTLWGK
jgi:hypothetical protein